MQYGLIGWPLAQSLSPEIHSFFIQGIDYQLLPLASASEVHAFLRKRDFCGVNVTIPWKREVLGDLDALDPAAAAIGAVNCIVNRGGRLTGYNTDCEGFRAMAQRNKLDFARPTAVLGTGGASLAVGQAIRELGGQPVFVSRFPHDDVLSYPEFYEQSFGAVVNTTPVGMKPLDEDAVLDMARCRADTVVDIVANPLRTRLQFEARQAGKRTLGGLEMLVRQAACADAHFFSEEIPEERIEACLRELLRRQRSLVLIGMPSAGKSTIGSLLAQVLHRRLVEMDALLEEKTGTSICDIFAHQGEEGFRRQERALAARLKEAPGTVISTGGGIVKDPVNMFHLQENGLVLWLRRDLALLQGTPDRPLSRNREDLKRLYEERKDLYARYADLVIDNNGTPAETVQAVLAALAEEKNI